jgi:sulfatase maturation enzyme AslB (radical SAM superfamily)
MSRPRYLTVESGTLALSMMPSLRCSMKCPHCYLSEEQRRFSRVMAIDELETCMRRFDDFYTARGLTDVTVHLCWYGGEPTQMPKVGDQEYFEAAVERIGAILGPDRYRVDHTVLTSLVGMSDRWFEIFRSHCGGNLYTSFDWDMRGTGYRAAWEKRAAQVVAEGLRLGTISVVNTTMLEAGPERVLDDLISQGVSETGWLQYLLTESNAGDYARLAPTMREYNDFMIGLHDHWRRRKAEGVDIEIGSVHHILSGVTDPGVRNTSAHTFYLMPDGSLQLPDYDEGHWQERLVSFGSLLNQPFEAILASPGRRAHLRKQLLRGRNPECGVCAHAGSCLMEFWKTNKPDDECWGAKRYVQHVLASTPLAEARGYRPMLW